MAYRRKLLSPRKLLLASVGVATMSYIGCGQETSGNLVAPDCEQEPELCGEGGGGGGEGGSGAGGTPQGGGGAAQGGGGAAQGGGGAAQGGAGGGTDGGGGAGGG